MAKPIAMTAILTAMLLALVLAGCSSEPLSLDDYLAELDCESFESEVEPATYDDLSADFTEAVERMSALAPPAEVAGWHEVRLDSLRASGSFIDQQPQDEEIDFNVLFQLLGILEEYEPRETEAVAQMSDATRERMVDAGCIDHGDVVRASVVGPDDHGNTLNAATPVQVGVPVAGVMGEDGEDDLDVFHFTADGGHIYQFDIELGTLINVDLTLLNSVGQVLAEGSTLPRTTPDGPPLHLIAKASEPGDYYVVVNGWPSGDPTSGLGSYTLTISRSEFVDNHGDDTDNATAISVGESIEGTSDYEGDVDVFLFTGEAGHLYTLDVISSAQYFGADVYERDPECPDGLCWVAGFTSIDGGDSWHAEEPSDYYIFVDGLEPGVSYTLTITGISEA